MSYAEIVTQNIITEFNEFKEQQLKLSSQEVFENSNRIHFYKEIHLFITENDLEYIFKNDELKILAECGTSLIDSLHEEYLSVENASISNWDEIEDIFDSLIKKEKENGNIV